MTGLPRLTITAAVAVLLTALSLQPTLQDAAWLIPTILCVALVAGTGYAARRLRVPRLLVPVLELGALLLLLILRFVREDAIWGFLPGRDTATDVRALLDEGFATISNYAPPAPVTPGLTFLLAASIALVAIVVDTIAVTYRSPALAGLPLLVLYAVPVSVVSHGVSWVYFGVAAAGWLALLLADGRERLGGWGRRLGTRTFAGDPTANDVPVVAEPLGAVGRRIGIASVALAVLIPAIVPGLSEAVFGRGLGDGTGNGGGTVNTVNPYVSLGSDLNRPDDSQVLTYTTTAEKPDYLRIVTLDSFDGINWVPASLVTSGHVASGPLPPPTGLDSNVATTPVTTTVAFDGLERTTWLPAPYPVTSVAIDGDSSNRWVWDTENRVIWSANDRTEDLKYTVSSLEVQPTKDQLRAAPSLDPVEFAKYTNMPESTPPIVATTAAQVTAGATDPYTQAVKLQEYFQGPGFTYDASQAQDASDPLTSFLNNKRGFCQQFAGTFAAMARSLSLPTRVVVGFVPGDKQPDGSWSVTWHDTHAWPEVYFEGTGWVRFEPTKRTDNGGVTQPAYTQATDNNERPRQDVEESPGAIPSGGPSASSSGVKPGTQEGDRDKGASLVAKKQFPWVWVVVPLLVVALLLVPWFVRTRQRRGRYSRAGGSDPRDAAAAAWEELAATCADLDLAWPASRTPRQVAASLIDSTQLERADAAVGPPAADALRRLALTTERARYARTAQPTPGLVADVTAARAGLLGWASRTQRLRASFAPVSMLSRVGARTADTLDWVDTAPRRARRAVGRTRTRQEPQPEHSTTSS